MNRWQLSRTMEILLVEDSASDAELARETLEDGSIPKNVYWVENAVDAWYFLKQQGKYANTATPDLILLDLNLPKKSGLEFLAEIKEHDRFKLIPVLVLTTSQSPDDINQAYLHHANCYLVKPSNLEEFVNLVDVLEKFWLSIVQLPSYQY